MELGVLIAAIVIFLLVWAFYSASERAIITVRTARIKELIAQGNSRAEFIKKLKASPETFFSTIQIGETISSVAIAVIGGIIAFRFLKPLLESSPWWIFYDFAGLLAGVLITIVIAFIILLSSQILMRFFAIRRGESLALWASPIVWYCLKIFSLPTSILKALTKLCLRIYGGRIKPESNLAVSDFELTMIFRDGFLRGMFSQQEQRLLHSVFEFGDTTVRRAMTPRTDIVAFDINDPIDKFLKLATEETFSRFPVYEDNLDNIKGIVHSRDLLYVYTQKELFVLKDIIKEAKFVPDSKPIAELMREMQKGKFQMAIVLDEFGGTDGIITMEDVLEEIVGDIQDEYDREISKITFLNPEKTQARVLATMPIDEFADEFDVEVEEGDFETVGGLLITELGKIPAKNEKFLFEGFSLKVELKEGHKIKYLLAEKLPSTESE